MGTLLQEQGDDEAIVDCTHFDCWFEDRVGEDASDVARMEAFSKASIIDKAAKLEQIAKSWEITVGRALLNLELFGDLEQFIMSVGWDNTLNLLVYGVLEAGYDVYVGETFIEIYSGRKPELNVTSLMDAVSKAGSMSELEVLNERAEKAYLEGRLNMTDSDWRNFTAKIAEASVRVESHKTEH